MTDVGATEAGTAAPGPHGAGGAGGAGDHAAAPGGEWPKKAADVVETVVDVIHDKAIRPVALVARGLVFGLLVAAMATVLVILASVAVIRILDVYAFPQQVWASYTVVGGLFTLAGLGLWSMRTVRPKSSTGR